MLKNFVAVRFSLLSSSYRDYKKKINELYKKSNLQVFLYLPFAVTFIFRRDKPCISVDYPRFRLTVGSHFAFIFSKKAGNLNIFINPISLWLSPSQPIDSKILNLAKRANESNSFNVAMVTQS